MEIQLLLTAFIVSSGLTAGASLNSHIDTKSTTSEGNGGIGNLRNLFDSILKDDREKTDSYRNILQQEAGKVQQDFETVKIEFQCARQKNSHKPEIFSNMNGIIDQKTAAVKREVGQHDGGSTLSTLERNKIKKLVTAISKTAHYTFKNHDLLLEALTHASLRKSKENPQNRNTNQKLEFLGDSILNMFVTIMLFEIFPDEEGGSLAKRKKELVCGSTVADVAKQIKLGEFLLMTEGERNTGGPQNPHYLEDGVEALIGAIYLDSGLDEVKTFVERYWRPLAENMPNLDPPKGFRPFLQEWVQKKGLQLPRYRVTKQSGPKHDIVFTVSLAVQNYGSVEANASSVKGAEQKAAKLMLSKIGIDPI